MKYKQIDMAILCIVFSGYMGLSVDIALPALSSISLAYHSTPASTQLIISLFIGVFALAQIVQGTLSDYFGRKRLILVSLGIFTISSFLCVFPVPFKLFLFFRALQAIGTAGVIIAIYAIIRNAFEGVTYEKNISYLAIGRSFSPILLAFIGGFINQYFNWRYLFIFSGSIGLLSFIVAYNIFKEIRIESYKKFQPKAIILDYKIILMNPTFIIYNIFCISTFSILLTYISSLPFLFDTIKQKSSLALGFYLGINSIFLVLGSGLTSITVSKLKNSHIIIVGLLILILAGLTMCYYLTKYEINTMAIVIPMYLLSIGIGIISPAAISMLLKPFKALSGQANALSGFFRFIIASLVSNFILQFDKVYISLTVTIITLGALNLFIALYTNYFPCKNIKVY